MRLLNKQMVILLAVVLGLFFSGTSYARPDNERGSRPNMGKTKEVLEKLNLSPQQETQIRKLQQTNRERTQELRRNLREKRGELRQELDNPNSDPAKIKALTSDLKDIDGRLIDERVHRVLRMKEMLSPEQYQAFCDTFKGTDKGDLGRRRR